MSASDPLISNSDATAPKVIFDKARLFLVIPLQARLADTTSHLRIHMPEHNQLGIDTSVLSDAGMKSVWTERDLVLDPSLHSAIYGLLGHQEGNRKPTFWRLDARAREDLNRQFTSVENSQVIAQERRKAGIEAVSGYGLVVTLSETALLRLNYSEDKRHIPIRIAAVDFYLSQTRLGQLVVELDLGSSDIHADVLIEVAHQLAHIGIGHSPDEWGMLSRLNSYCEVIAPEADQADAKGAFTLMQLAETLLCPSRHGGCFAPVSRAFTYVLAVTSQALSKPNSTILAARLARRHNDHYSPSSAIEGVEFATPFETITHACSSDGGSALVTNSGDIKFLETFANDVGESVYLKLALVAHKDMHDLAALSQGSSITIEHSERDDDVALKAKLHKIGTMQERVLNYRLAHRFSVASYGVNHNLVHAAWRRATNAEKLITEISDDNTQATAYLQTVRSDIEHKRTAEAQHRLANQTSWLQALLTFFAALEGSHVLMKLLAEVNHVPTTESKIAEQFAKALKLELPKEVPISFLEGVLIGAPFAIAIIAAGVMWWFSRKGSKMSAH
jgi:hypothetical protein